MKTIFAFTLCLFAFGSYAQEEIVVSKEPTEGEKFQFNVVEKIPVIKGCANLSAADQEQQKECMQYNIAKHVGDNFQFPEDARKHGVQGKIFVTFIVEKNGELSNISILKGVEREYKNANKKKRSAAKDLDKEAIRVIKLLEFEAPAYQKGKPVRMQYTMPINAKLS